MTSDGELLSRYAETGSEDAFAELVGRHLDLVYSAALRQVNGDVHLAQDVAQSVFADLARKAASLSSRPGVTGWLYTSTHFAAAKAVRTEQRRHTNEQEADSMRELLLESGHELDWTKFRPALDAVMHELNEADREAILLRFFENRQLAEIGERFGLSEDAARKRVDRALDKLREHFAHKGITTTAAVLSVVIAANAVQPAPAGLAVTISTAAALAGTTLATAVTATATKTIAMTALQKALVTTTIIAAVGTAIYALQQQSQVRSMQQQQTSLAAQIEELTRERDATANQLTALQSMNEQLRHDAQDVLRLRAEVAQLHRQPAAQAAAPAPSPVELANPTDSTAARLLFKAKFVSLPTDALGFLGSAGLPLLANGTVVTLAGEQFNIISEAIQGASDATVISGPRILTFSETPCTVALTRSVPLGDTNVQVGVILDIDPVFTPPAFELGLVARLSHVAKVSTPQGWQDVLDTVKLSTNVRLLEGQTVALVKNIPDEGWLDTASTNSPAGPKTLLVFVTPSVVPEDPVPGQRSAAIAPPGDTNAFIGGTLVHETPPP